MAGLKMVKPSQTIKSATKASKVSPKKFPTKELNEWLSTRSYWNHEDWLSLLNNLKDKGYTEWTNNQEGQEKIGKYLEESRLDQA